MKATVLIAFICYSLCAVVSAVFAIIYLVRTRFVPYHQEALGLAWEKLEARLQTLLLALMRSAGGALLAASVSMAFLLLIPFRAEQACARYAIPIVGLTAALPAFYANILVRVRTKAHAPTIASAAAVGLLALGIIFSSV